MCFVAVNLEAHNVPVNTADVLVYDDPYDEITWDPAANTGTFSWIWNKCCTDGALLGPFPASNFSLDLRLPIDEMVGIEAVVVQSFNSTSGSFDQITFDKSSQKHGSDLDIELQVSTCNEYCAQFTSCGECTATERCSYVLDGPLQGCQSSATIAAVIASGQSHT